MNKMERDEGLILLKWLAEKFGRWQKLEETS